MSNLQLPSQETLLAMFKYDPITGHLLWKERPQSEFCNGYKNGETSCKTWNTQNAGKIAGGPRSDGYIRVGIWGKRFMAHRIIWLMQTGETPIEVDHINGNRSDNRWCNLRAVNRLENLRNLSTRTDNTSGVTGVSYAKRDDVYLAYITVGGKTKVVGRYKDIQDAIAARKAAEASEGFHPNHGKSVHSDHSKSM